MQVIVYTSEIINGRTIELMVEINGELMTAKKAMKKLKRG